MLSNLKFIFSMLIIFVLMFSAVVATVLNMYKPTYKVMIGDTFIGYFSSENEFENVYNTLCSEKKIEEQSVKTYLAEEPKFETSYIRDSVIAEQNVYTALRDNIQTEYTIYTVKADEETLTFSSKDEATKYIAKVKEEVPDVETSIAEEKKQEISEYTTIEVANNIFDDIVSRNKPVEVPKTYISYNTSYQTSTSGAGSNVASASAAEKGVWPTTTRYVSSYYGWRGASMHTGIDIAGRTGDPIYAYKTGVVTFSGWGGSYGYLLKVDHGNGISSWYAHNSQLLVSAGDTVTQGQTIALQGSTGNSTGPHLHFEIRVNGVAVNPYSYIT